MCILLVCAVRFVYLPTHCNAFKSISLSLQKCPTYSKCSYNPLRDSLIFEAVHIDLRTIRTEVITPLF